VIASTHQYDSDVDELLSDTAESLFKSHAGPDRLRELEAGGWLEEAWRQVEGVGLHLLEVPDELGGGAGTFAYTATALRAAGRHLGQVPLAGTSTASWLLAQAGIEIPAGPLAIGRPGDALPHARYAAAVVLLHADDLELVRRPAFGVEPGENVAGEPRDVVTSAEAGTRHPVGPELVRGAELRLACARAAETVGALEGVQQLSLDHVRAREQFGVPIARFPVVRERLAVMAEEVAAARAALDVARLAIDVGDAEIAVAAAKVCSATAARDVARIAHQLHGAIGVTTEHALQFYTRRLWAWRDEDGSERQWAERLGRALVAGDAWVRLVEAAPV
jgi:acyl-CoA dehydrogenase